MALIPPRLKEGDTIGVVTPSAPISTSPSPDPYGELDKGIAYLKDLGFEVVLGEHAREEGGIAAGTAEQRAGDINAMFADPNVQAIISSHGGISANSCLPYLDYDLIRANPKILMGFSDVDTLHLALYAQTGLVTFHGNMVIWFFGMEPQEFDRQEFIGRLVEGQIGRVEKHSAWRTIRGTGQAEGVLLGGHIMVIERLMGTPYCPDFSDAILMLEVADYEPDVLHSRMHHFMQGGLFDSLRGVLLGYSKENDTFPSGDIVGDVLGYDIPIVKTDDFGHACPNTVLPVGARVRLDASTASLEILEPCVA